MTKKPELLFEGTFSTTPEILLGVLHDYWIDCAPSLAGTEIGGLRFELTPGDEHFSRIYIKAGPSNLTIIADIDIRRLNENLLRITIPSTANTRNYLSLDSLSWEYKYLWAKWEDTYPKVDIIPWKDVYPKVDIFLLGFATHLKELFSAKKQAEAEVQEIEEPKKLPKVDQLPERRIELDGLCVKWVGRGYVPKSYSCSEFLADNQVTYVTVSEFKRALKDACARGIISQNPKTKRYEKIG